MLRKQLIIIFIVVSLFFAAKNLLLITNKHVQLFSGVRDVFAESTDIKVWFEVNTRRVKRKEIAKNSSYIWDGRKVYISAARNEYEPFQLILRSEHDVGKINITISDLLSEDNVISKDIDLRTADLS